MMTIENLVTILGATGGTAALVELVRYWRTRRQTEQQAEAEAQQATAEADDKWFEKYEHQLDRMNTQIEFKDKRIEALNKENADKDARYYDQTKRLRESQDNEQRSQLEINRLNGIIIEKEREIARLNLLLKDVTCHKLSCLDRKPKNEHTRKAEAEAEAGAPLEHGKQSTHVINEDSD